jgi:dTDP-4-dehydrorhamnose reductase
MKKILIIGKGYIGNILFNSLCKDNSSVQIISKQDIDYTSNYTLTKFLLSNDTFDYVINCAGYTGIPNIDQAETNKAECWKYNVTVPYNISKICAQHNIEFINISTGCIYSGYTKDFTEEDVPNFGMFDTASFYSKSKHAYELVFEHGMNLRIRMPYCNTKCGKNFLSKIISFNNICNLRNSKTYINDLVKFLEFFVESSKLKTTDVGLLNFVNPSALYIEQIVDILTEQNLNNPNWSYTDISNLKLAAPRSNCVLSTDKLRLLFPEFKLQDEKDAIIDAIKNW